MTMMSTAFFWPHLVLVSMTTATGLFPSQDVHVSDEPDSHDMDDGMRHLNIIGLFPFSGSWQGGESMLASTKLAIHQVNNMHILPGYHLHLLPSDTKCDPGYGLKALFSQLYKPPRKIMIIGAGCSAVTQVTARVSHLWNLVQVSYSSGSPSLSDKKSYPLFGRVAASGTVTNPARISFIRHFGWSRVATIHQSYESFSKTTEDLISKIHEEGMTITRSEIFHQDPTRQVRNLLDNDCRIIVGSFYVDKARKVLCEAYKIGLYGRQIVWILPGFYDIEWWKTPDDSIDCTPDQLGHAVEGYFSASIVYLNPYPVPSVSGWLPSDFVREYMKAIDYRKLDGNNMASQGFDNAWAVALSLNITRQRLLDMGSSKGLEDFNYNDTDMAALLYSSLLNVSFMGIRGPIAFDSSGDTVGIVKLERVQGGVTEVVGLHNPMAPGEDKWAWSKDNPVVWKGGVPPRDSKLLRYVYQNLSVGIYVTMCILAIMGIVLSGAFLTFNILLRQVKLVKMSSPRLNNAILMGCISCYCSIFLKDTGEHGVTGCELKTALLMLGISTTFGALFAKTWRVHVIFTISKKRKIMSDTRLFGILGILVLVNVVVLVTWRLVDPRSVKITSVLNTTEIDMAGEVVVHHQMRSCVSSHHLYFVGTLYAIHTLVLLLGIFLAYETRKVHYPELNDSKLIGMCIYNVALLSIPAVVVNLALNPGLDLQYAITSSLVLLGTTATQCIIFVPKVLAYRYSQVQDDAGDTAADGDDGTASTVGATRQPGRPSGAKALEN